MRCEKILGTTHHGTFKKVIDVPLEKHELTEHSLRRIAKDGIEIEIEIDEDMQEGDILVETEFYVYAVKIYVPKPQKKLDKQYREKCYL